MATPETPDEWLQKVKVQLKYIYSAKYLETDGGEDEKRAACWTMYDQLKPSELFPSEFPNSPVIDFRSGRIDKETLKKEFQQAFAGAKETTDDFVDTHINTNKMLGPVSVSLKTVNKSNYRQYISCKLIELSLAGQVVWETKDGKAAKGTTDFWKFKYKERRLIEAAQLYSSCKTRNVPHKKEELLPVMYWKDGEGDTDWVESSTCYCRTEGGSKSPVKGQPPSWATNYIKDKRIEAKVFLKEEIEEPNNHPNAVYILLCRFNGKGVPEEARVQAYAGRAEHGVEDRWLSHAGADDERNDGRNDGHNDGRNDGRNDDDDGSDGESNTAKMINKETCLIKKLKLKDMKCGMNGRL
ncbi:hypothetical protein Bbelb_280710 [Branchiostoma belcheri]|nr:hypothetical protein Bbelb_280710 [Branchiostoma belcheri]